MVGVVVVVVVVMATTAVLFLVVSSWGKLYSRFHSLSLTPALLRPNIPPDAPNPRKYQDVPEKHSFSYN